MQNIDLSKIVFPTNIVVTEQDIDLSFLTKKQQDFYKNLFSEFIDLYFSKNKPRVVVGFTGPTGSGKSVITTLFQEFSKQVELPFRFQVLSVDAFHFQNKFLEANKDSEGTVLKDRKGRFDTYNVTKLLKVLEDFCLGKVIRLPEYSRRVHDPLEDVYTVSEEHVLLVIEGLWLLSDIGDWKRVSSLLDYKVFVEADEEKVKEMVIRRHERGGKSDEDARHYYSTVDEVNSRLINLTKNKADKIIPPYYELGLN